MPVSVGLGVLTVQELKQTGVLLLLNRVLAQGKEDDLGALGQVRFHVQDEATVLHCSDVLTHVFCCSRYRRFSSNGRAGHKRDDGSESEKVEPNASVKQTFRMTKMHRALFFIALISLAACPEETTTPTVTADAPDASAPDSAAGDGTSPDATPDAEDASAPDAAPDVPQVDSATPDAADAEAELPPQDVTAPDGVGDAAADATADGVEDATADGTADAGTDAEGDVVGACEGPNPQGCIANGCPSGETCQVLPNDCQSSGCTCDESTGTWNCLADCNGGTCVAPTGGACTTDADCQFGLQWCVQGTCQECDNSGLLCKIGCAEGTELPERNGCFPCECTLANACESDNDCDQDGANTCVAGPVCLPWCAFDDPSCCYGNTCQAGPSACDSPNPQACLETGCAPGMVCEPSPLAVCMASSCTCDETMGDWGCTKDCVSGVCVETPSDLVP